MKWLRPWRSSPQTLHQPQLPTNPSGAAGAFALNTAGNIGPAQSNWQPLRPSFLALLALITGLVAGHSLQLQTYFAGVAIIALGGVFALVRFRRPTVIHFLALFVGLGLVLQSQAELAKAQALQTREQLFSAPTELVQLTGIVQQPMRSPLTGGSFWLQPGATFANRGTAYTVAAPVVVWAYDIEAVNTLRRGDYVSLIGKPRPIATQIQGPSIDSYAAGQGAVVGFQATQLDGEIQPATGVFSAGINLARATANAVEASYYRHLPEAHASLLAAITLGRTGGITPELRTAARQIGIAHIFAISGLHTGIVGFGLLLLLRFVLPVRIVPFAIALAMIFFCAMVEFRSSALRAAFFVTLFSFEPLMKRRFEPLSLLSSVALVLLLINPKSFWQVDFQLSFLCAAVLLLLLPLFAPLVQRMQEYFEGKSLPSWIQKVITYVLGTFVTSTLIQLILAPLLIRNMGEFSLISPVSNTVVLFLMPFVLLVSYASALVEIVFSVALLSHVQWVLAEFLLQATTALSLIPFAAVPIEGQFPLGFVILFYLAVAGSPWLLMRPSFRPNEGPGKLLFYSMIPFTLLAIILVIPKASDLGTRVLFLEVSQGDATVIQHRNTTILIDVGPPTGKQLVRELQQYGISSIDLLALTHADADHIGGLAELLLNYPVAEIWVNNAETYEAIILELQTSNQLDLALGRISIPMQGTALQLDERTSLTVLHPDDAYIPENPRNDASMVFLFTKGTTDVLLMADLEAHGERYVLQEYADLLPSIEILKAGHHGSRTSSTPEFLKTLGPLATIMSCGLNNRYQHPHSDVLQRFLELNIPVYRTDLMGTITLEIETDSFSFQPERRLGLQEFTNPLIPEELFP